MATNDEKPVRIGEILINQGVLKQDQVDQIVQAQKQMGMPFGALAEQMFNVSVKAIEQAWVEQYHRFTGTIDLSRETVDEAVIELISRRQAWQFEILPIRVESTGELLMAASRERLARAVTFAANQLQREVYFRVADSLQLRKYLRKYYSMPEISPEMLERARRYALSA